MLFARARIKKLKFLLFSACLFLVGISNLPLLLNKSTVDLMIINNEELAFDAPILAASLTSSSLEATIQPTENYDLIIWLREPVLVAHPLIVTLDIQFPNLVGKIHHLRSMEETQTVDVRVCPNTTTCSDFHRNRQNLKKLLNMSRYEERSVIIYEPFEQNKVRVKLNTHNKTKTNGITVDAVTFWSPEHKKNIAIDFSGKRKTRLNRRLCLIGSKGPKACPKPCPQNMIGKGDKERPFMFDRTDNTCKSSHEDGLPPKKAFGGPCWYTSTCFTPEATIINSTWPWKDDRERLRYYPTYSNNVEKAAVESKHIHCKSESSMFPTYKYEARFECNEQELQCPAYGAFQHHVFFIPQAKLIFCGMPKAGMTEWIKFFRYSYGALDYLAFPHEKKDRESFLLGNLAPEKASQLLNDPNWTKAVFFRNPYERLLSAYLDKVIGENYAYHTFNEGSSHTTRGKMPFEKFVDLISETELDNKATRRNCKKMKKGLHKCTDPHWKPQLLMCGLDYLLPKFDFIGRLDHIGEHTKLLLEKVGLWEDYGKTFDDGKDTILRQPWSKKYAIPAPKRLANETIWGFNQRGPSRLGRSGTHSSGAKFQLDKFYTPELYKKVRKLYALDFEVWDEISSTSEVLNGKYLKLVHEHCAENDNRTTRL